MTVVLVPSSIFISYDNKSSFSFKWMVISVEAPSSVMVMVIVCVPVDAS